MYFDSSHIFVFENKRYLCSMTAFSRGDGTTEFVKFSIPTNLCNNRTRHLATRGMMRVGSSYMYLQTSDYVDAPVSTQEKKK